MRFGRVVWTVLPADGPGVSAAAMDGGGKPAPDAGHRDLRQPSAGVVAVRQGPHLAGQRGRTEGRIRLPLLQRAAACAGGERPGDAGPGAGGPVAPHPQRRADASGRDARQPAGGLVAVSPGARVALVAPGGEHRQRLSHLLGAAPGGQKNGFIGVKAVEITPIAKLTGIRQRSHRRIVPGAGWIADA